LNNNESIHNSKAFETFLSMFNHIVDQRAPYRLASIKEAVVNQTFVNVQTKKMSCTQKFLQ